METQTIYRENPWKKGFRYVGMFILGGLAAIAFGFLFGYFVMLLWNWLMPSIFGLTTITFWQAVGIIILARLIFGAFKHHDKNYHDYPRKRFSSKCKDKEWWKHHKSNWRYFDDYWSEEGEEAFNSYIERKKTKTENNITE